MELKMKNLWISEGLKWIKTKIWLFPFFILLPLAYSLFMLGGVMIGEYHFDKVNHWVMAIMMFCSFGGSIFYPFLSASTANHINRIEDKENSWKFILTLSYSWNAIFFVKILWLVLFALVTQGIVFIGLLSIGIMMGLTDPILWGEILFKLFVGWIGLSVLSILQFWISYFYKNGIKPVLLSVFLALPSFYLAELEYGFIYPWALPVAGMLGTEDVSLYLLVCLVYSLVFTYVGIGLARKKGI